MVHIVLCNCFGGGVLFGVERRVSTVVRSALAKMK